MGQKFFEDKIGALSHSSGNIFLAASRLTIGGQQYATSNLSVALPSMTANTRYQVFAVQSGGVVSLVISQNENSVGPAGYVSWKLVGSLYANEALSFGGFLNIKGVPSSDEISHNASLSTSGGSLTLNPTGAVQPVGYWKRIGDAIEYLQSWKNGSGGAATGTAGNLLISGPTNLICNNANRPSDGNYGPFIGVTHGYNVTEGAVSSGVYVSGAPNSNRFQIANDASGSVYTLADVNANFGMNFIVRYRIVGWSNTPIEAL
jgi:hypothetical protein